MNFSVGYQRNLLLMKLLQQNAKGVQEIYFPWPGFTTGRGVPDDTPEERLKTETDLTELADAGFQMNWLLNGNCYGRYSQSRTFFQKLGDTCERLKQKFYVSSVTTTSPLIARFLKMNFPELEIRASVNMEIGTVEGIEYLMENFDSFYLKREYNYDLERLEQLYSFCHSHGKKLFLLANSGCLNYCSARTFHDNLVAHQHEIAEMDNAFGFHGVCHDFLHDAKNRSRLLRHSNFIRPEDVPHYEGKCDGMKLATRTNRNPSTVVEAYVSGHFSGNLWELTEPSHAQNFYPQILANDRIAEDYATHRLKCDKNCPQCGFCDNVQQKATLNLTMEGIHKC